MINNLDKLSQKEIQELFNRISVHIQDIKIPLDTDIQSNKNYFLKKFECKDKALILNITPSNIEINRLDPINEYHGCGVYIPIEIVNNVFKPANHLSLKNSEQRLIIFHIILDGESENPVDYNNIFYVKTNIKDINSCIEKFNNSKETVYWDRIVFVFDKIKWEEIVHIFNIKGINIFAGTHKNRYLLRSTHYRLIKILEIILKYNENLYLIKNNNTKPLPYNITSLIWESEYNSKYEKVNNLKSRLANFRIILKILEGTKNHKYHSGYTQLFYSELDYKVDQNNLYFFLKDDIKNFYQQLLNVNTNILPNKTNQKLTGFIQKREYSTSISNINSENKTKIDNSYTNNLFNKYLQEISELLNNNNYSPYEKQLMLERNWIELVKKQYEDIEYIEKKHSHSLVSRLINIKSTLDILEQQGTLEYKFPIIHKLLNTKEILLLSYSVASNGVLFNLSYTNIASILGNKILFIIYANNILKNKEYKIFNLEEYTNSRFGEIFTYELFVKYLNFDNKNFIELGAFFIDLLCRVPFEIFEKKFDNDYYSIKNDTAKLRFSERQLLDVKNNLIIEPNSLPMISPPIRWSDKKVGGYLNNQIMKNDIVSGSTFHGHKLENRENLYKAVNNMASIKFKYNNLLIDFLENDGKYLLEIFKNSSKSELYQISTTLNIAKVYRDIPIYIPLQVDFRGRIYTKSFYSNYQGGDFNKALIEFYDGQKLTDSGLDYLYIYIANIHNENNISKTSNEERITWVKFNLSKMISLDKNFIMMAENPIIFASLCLIIKELDRNRDYEVKIPVFLDATCSGIQHLAALISDIDLALNVNLIPNDSKLGPSDIYEELRKPINEEIRRVGREELAFDSLKHVDLTRKNIKLPIMTKTYNVTVQGVVEQLINAFSKDLNITKKNFKKAKFKVPSIIEGQTVELNISDLNKIAHIIHNSIFKKYPGLSFIYKYFMDMSKLMATLNLSVSWFTPSGLTITQHYYKMKKTKLFNNFYNRRETLILNEVTKDLDKIKQRNASIPNIIHSLDASHLISVINKAYENGNKNVITVHDCFGTHPNDMSSLVEIIKLEFIKLYAKYDFINKFHERNLDVIKDNGFIINLDSELNQNYVTDIDNSLFLYVPNKPIPGKLNIYDVISSKYIVN